ncbi:STAS domain-containing protein [Catellatospora sichuanensis]|uniref:STAS domain-containing protein n=1 Tax=Catellatospora sichuanensis TaxID=1969805 RepID=UPI001642ABA7|nr:STAS domain-containing protein [Catellatospora sichuanensis]
MEVANVVAHGDAPHEVVVAVSGEIDLGVRDELLNALHATIRMAGVTSVVVDLSRVSFMDSTGLHVLLAARETAHSSGVGFNVVGATGLARRVLAVTGMLELLTGEASADTDEPVSPTIYSLHADPPAAEISR